MPSDKSPLGDGVEAITSLEDLGRYLRQLRDSKRVTQQSLSSKTGSIAGPSITRSRISEIENAKRDPVRPQELRAYMLGLKCAPQHVDKVVKVLMARTTIQLPKESLSERDAPSAATLDIYPAGLGGADAPTRPPEILGGGHDESEREDQQQISTQVNTLTTSIPQPARRRWSRHRITIAATAALLISAVAMLSIARSIQGENENQPKPPLSITSPSVQPNGSLVPGDAEPEFVKDVTFPDGSPVRVNQTFTKIWEIRNVGSVIWRDRYLTRETPEDPDLCSSPPRVPIPLTLPGQDVQIGVTITAPNYPGSCHLDWKMTDSNGTKFFPEAKPVYVIVNVLL